MAVQFWGDQVLFDSGDVAMHEDCCCFDCEFCLPDTFTDTTYATVDFTGTITNDGCDSCLTDVMNPTFELPRVALTEAASSSQECCYLLEGDLGCNDKEIGFDWLEFCWAYSGTGGYMRGYLTFHYICDGDPDPTYGYYQWQGSLILYQPTKHACKTTWVAPNAPSNPDAGCTPAYRPCDMANVRATVTFT